MPKPKLTNSELYKRYVKEDSYAGLTPKEKQKLKCQKRRGVSSCKECLHYEDNCYEN